MSVYVRSVNFYNTQIGYLYNAANSEKRCIPVVILDEAQYLSNSILRDLVMLLNFDMDSKDCCILILMGLGSMNRSLRMAVNEPLRQRIIVNYHADGICREEAKEYIEYCLSKSGAKEPVFSDDAVEAAWRLPWFGENSEFTAQQEHD